MNDTHGEPGKGWYGFDLDGTLAVYDKWEGIDRIGEPVKPMVDLMRKMYDEGKGVKILTARVSPRSNPDTRPNPYPEYASGDSGSGKPGNLPAYAADALLKQPYLSAGHLDFYRNAEWTAKDFVSDWCMRNLGFLPQITHEKDHLMLELYDDRVKQVVTNEGTLVEDRLAEVIKVNHDNAKVFDDLYRQFMSMSFKLERKWGGFWSGVVMGTSLMVIVISLLSVYDSKFREKTPKEQALDHLHTAIIEVQEAGL